MVDTIRLAHTEPGGEFERLELIVNGRYLSEFVAEQGGSDCGLSLRTVSYQQDATIFSEVPSSPFDLQVLECGCGVSGCSGTYVATVRSGSTVTWTSIWATFVQVKAKGRQRKRGEWQYVTSTALGAPQLKFGPFVFSAEQYDAVMAAGRRIAKRWRDEQELFEARFRLLRILRHCISGGVSPTVLIRRAKERGDGRQTA